MQRVNVFWLPSYFSSPELGSLLQVAGRDYAKFGEGDFKTSGSSPTKMSDLAAKDLEPAGNIKNHSHRDLDRRNADEDFHLGGKHKPDTVEYGIEPNAAHPELTSTRSLDQLHPDADFKLGARVHGEADKGVYESAPNASHPDTVGRDFKKVDPDADFKRGGAIKQPYQAGDMTPNQQHISQVSNAICPIFGF